MIEEVTGIDSITSGLVQENILLYPMFCGYVLSQSMGKLRLLLLFFFFITSS